jgi:hypothetical protein
MTVIVERIGIVVALSALTWLILWAGQRVIEGQRRKAFAAKPFPTAQAHGALTILTILAFSSADCRQCHTHQNPVLQQILTLRAGRVVVQDVDAPSHPQLTDQYHILTLPSTVVLDTTGRVLAVNYGFANTRRLLDQIDAAVAEDATPVIAG